MPERKPRNNKEWRFQSWADRLIDRVVLPPMFTTGLDSASQSTDNARARAAARGIRSGIPDVFVAQLPGCSHGLSVWLELKRGAPVTTVQEGIHTAMRRAGCAVMVCRTLREVVAALKDVGFALHPNALAIADEFEMRCEASEKAPRKPAMTKARTARPSAGDLRRLRATGFPV